MGNAPNVIQRFFVTPDSAVLEILGSFPTANAVTPASNDAVFVGYAPSVVEAALVTPTGGSVLIGSAPVLVVTGVTKVPDAGVVSTLGQAPLLNLSITPDTVDLGLFGDVPTASEGSFVNTVTGTASLAGNIPSILGGAVSNPGAGALAIVGSVPKSAFTITPGTAVLTLVSTTPGVRNPNWSNINTAQTPNWQLIAA